MSQEEKMLISLMKAGNSFAFEKLYFCYSKKLYNFAFNILKCKEDAEGIVQNVFTKIWETRSEINTELSFGAYIFRIAKNMMLNQLRKKNNRERIFKLSPYNTWRHFPACWTGSQLYGIELWNWKNHKWATRKKTQNILAKSEWRPDLQGNSREKKYFS